MGHPAAARGAAYRDVARQPWWVNWNVAGARAAYDWARHVADHGAEFGGHHTNMGAGHTWPNWLYVDNCYDYRPRVTANKLI